MMKTIRDRITHSLKNDAGFTLIEVVIAISIMGIIVVAGVGMSISSQDAATAQQRQALAVTIANRAMESVTAMSAVANPATGVSHLVDGRTEPAVTASWEENASVQGIDASYPSWDPEASTGATPAIPLSAIGTQSGTEYTTHIVIGACYQPRAGGDCVAGLTLPPALADWAPMVRVMVIVRWNVGTTCSTDGCSYQTTSLFDPQTDLIWNTHG